MDFSLSGGCDSFACDWTTDANFSGLPFNFDDDWVGVAIEKFKARLDLKVVQHSTKPTNEILVPLLGNSGLKTDLGVRRYGVKGFCF